MDSAAVDLVPMVQLAEKQARNDDDDWTGLTDRAERKKRQNRLNQRAWRKRNALTTVTSIRPRPSGASGPSGQGNDTIFIHQTLGHDLMTAGTSQSISGSSSFQEALPPGKKAEGRLRTGLVETVTSLALSGPPAREPPPPLHQLIQPLIQYRKPDPTSNGADRHFIPLFAIHFPLSPDHYLITLVQYNVLRATLVNIMILGLEHVIPFECGTLPRFSFPSTPSPGSIPVDLQHTPLQQAVRHKHWIDIIPDRVMRDNLILNMNKIDEDEWCNDLVGGLYEGFSDCETRGALVWGDPWLTESWEISEGFLKKWGFVLRGCRATAAATNRWRISRGVEPLDFSAVLAAERELDKEPMPVPLDVF